MKKPHECGHYEPVENRMNAATTNNCSTELNWTNRIIDLQIPQIPKNCSTLQQTVCTQRLRSGDNGPIVAVAHGPVKYQRNYLTPAVTTRYENFRRADNNAKKVEGERKLLFRPDGQIPRRTEVVESQDVTPFRRLDHNAKYRFWHEKVVDNCRSVEDVGPGQDASVFA